MMLFGGGMLLLWLLLIGAVVVAVVGLGGRSPGPRTDTAEPAAKRLRDRSPEEILQERFAKGEIDREEYTDMRATLDL